MLDSRSIRGGRSAALVDAAILMAIGAGLMLLSEHGFTGSAVWITSAVVCCIAAVRWFPVPSIALWFLISYVGLFYVLPIVDAGPLGVRKLGEEYAQMTIGGLHAFIASWLLLDGQRLVRSGGRHITDQLWRVTPVVGIGVTLVSIMGALTTIVVIGGLGEMVALSRVEHKQSITGAHQAGTYGMLLAPVGLFAAPFAWRLRPGLGAGIFLANVLVVTVHFVPGTARTPVIAAIVAFGLGVVYSKYALPEVLSVRGLLHGRGRIILLILVVGMVLAMGAALVLRVGRSGFGEGGAVQRVEEAGVEGVLERGLGNDWSGFGAIGYAPVVLRAMEYSDRYEMRLGGQSYYRVLFVPIPRFIWEDKPESTARVVASWMNATDVQSYPPGAQGDAYINFGSSGVLVFVFLGVLAAAVDRWANVNVFIVIVNAAPMAFHLARGAFTNSLVAFTFMILVVAVLSKHAETGGAVARMMGSLTRQGGRGTKPS